MRSNKRFPNARAVAPAAVVDRMPGQLAPKLMDGFWRRLFPDQIADDPDMADPLDGESIELEGHQLIPVATGHTDTADSTSLHVPSIGLITAGDVVYNGISHPPSDTPPSASNRISMRSVIIEIVWRQQRGGRPGAAAGLAGMG
jgi:glyoxylase-like metal-dependent hydrolase (beta-lactamase superfamily II)